MARSAQPNLVEQAIPSHYPEVEAESPAFSIRGQGFRKLAPTTPDAKGNLGWVGLKAPDAFAENADPYYCPFVITRR